MRTLSLVLALAATAAGVTAVQAQDRYSSRGVVYLPPAAQAQQGPGRALETAAAERPAVVHAAYTPQRLLSWPGKVGGPQPRAAAPAPAEPLAPPAAAPVAAQPIPRAPLVASTGPAAQQQQRFASINSRPSTAPAPYPAPPRMEAPVRQTQIEQPAPRLAAAPTPVRRPAPQPAEAQLPQSIYSAPAPAAPAPAQTASLAPAAGGYPPATKEPWRRLLGPVPAAQPAAQGVAVPLPGPAKAPPAQAAAPEAKPVKKNAKAPAAPAPSPPPAPAPVYRSASAANTGTSTRFYSVHRQFGVAPDPITMPKQFFLDGSPDLSEPPPPPLRRIPPTSGQSTAQIRAAQARSQESPDAPAG